MALGSFIKSILGGGGTTTTAYTDALVDLERLQRGLAGRAARFIDTGEDRPVLSHIASVTGNTRQRGQQFRITATSAQSVQARNFGGQPDRLARFAWVHAAMRPGNIARHGRDHEKSVPEVVRTLFDLLEQHYGAKELKSNPTTMPDAHAAARILGASDADLVNLAIGSGYAARRLVLESVPLSKSVETLPIKAFTAVYAMRDAGARAEMLDRMAKMPLASDLGLLDFLMEQIEGTSTKVRDSAIAMLAHQNPVAVEDRAKTALGSGKAATRAAAVAILGNLATPTAMKALETRKEQEKSQAVLAAIDLFLTSSSEEVAAVKGGYMDAFGAEIKLPDYAPLTDDGRAPFGPDLLKRFQQIDAKNHQAALERHAQQLEYWKKNGKKYAEPKKPVPQKLADQTFEVLQSADPIIPFADGRRPFNYWANQSDYAAVIAPLLDQLPLYRVVRLALLSNFYMTHLLGWTNNPAAEYVQDALADGRLDPRQLFALARQARMGLRVNHGVDTAYNQCHPDAYLTAYLSPNRYSYDYQRLMPGAWIFAAEHLDLVLGALPPRGTDAVSALRALWLLDQFPSLPKVAVQAVLFCAIDDRRKIREAAQKLLADIPGIDDQLIDMIGDTRQAVRANAARLLADRGAKPALKPIVARLKKEKSELARADLISAVARLGGDTAPYLGQPALLKEAQALVDKLPDAKIAWLDQKTAPALVWADGKPADPVLLDGWLRLALKLKSPSGSPLFGLYLDQLDSDCVTKLCDWVLDNWLSYDTFRPASDELRARAYKMADAEMAKPNSWMAKYLKTRDNIANSFLSSMMAGYPNSGSDSKGILALTHRATPTRANSMIGTYLKQHGKRVSQAKSLVETLAAMESQEALQLLVATATRFKQRTVRELAAQSVSDIAEARGWTEEELADRSIPSGGFEEGGVLVLEVGEEAKPYVARLGSDLTIKLFNPDGKEVKAIPAGKDDNTKEAKSLLSAARKTVKEVTTRQQARLYDAMLALRVWDRADWQSDLADHPVMQRLIERVIWRGQSVSGQFLASFRPTAEGDFLDANGDDVDISQFAKIDIAHTTNMDETTRKAWLSHFEDFEIKSLFPQISRPVLTLPVDQKKETKLLDRQGWLMTTFKVRSAATKAGFERGEIVDSGGFYTYFKDFRAAGIRAELEFTGSHVPEEDYPAALKFITFQAIKGTRRRPMTLENVPPVLLSEVWNDLHDMAKSGAFDPDWEKKGLY